jgi:hypothetical protein
MKFTLTDFLADLGSIGIDWKSQAIFMRFPEAYEGTFSQWKSIYQFIADKECPYKTIKEIQEAIKILYSEYMKESE